MNDMPPFTPRNVAKFVVTTTIQLKTAVVTQHAIADHTTLESNDITVRVAGGVVGWGVSRVVKPYTDLAVDKTADFVSEKRENRRIRKQKKNDNK
jgi:hypothetical protein